MKIRGNTVGTPMSPRTALIKCENLTEEEKAIARQNIGAMGDTFPALKTTGNWRKDSNGNLVIGVNDSRVTEIRFVADFTPPDGAISWDAGVNAGEITAYLVDNIVTVSANGKSKIRLEGNHGADFSQLPKLRTVKGLEMLDPSGATGIGGMFSDCPELIEVDISFWCCDKVAQANGLFNNCTNLRSAKLPYSLRACKTAYGAFGNCVSLEYADLGGLNIVNTASKAAYPIFVGCKNLREVILCNISVMEAAAGNNAPLFADCVNLQKVTFKDGVIENPSLFEGMTHLKEVTFCGGITSLPEKTFSKCLSLERATGLRKVTSIGDKAFIYTAAIKDVDLNPAILTNIGESAFRLSSIEDCIDMETLKPSCAVGKVATRSVRWNAAELNIIQNTVTPSVLLRVPHPDSQKNYDYVFGQAPHPDTGAVTTMTVALSGCSMLALYHEWQCLNRGTDFEKTNFEEFWNEFFTDFYIQKANYHDEAIEQLGWTCDDTGDNLVESRAALNKIIDRLNDGLPTFATMRSANISGGHDLLIVGAEAISGKLAVLDSNITHKAELVWVKFEDIFTGADDGDRIHIHTEKEE